MRHFQVKGAAFFPNHATPINVECVQTRRLPYLQILGCSASTGAELREKVLAALDSIEFRLPARKFTVNFQPALPDGRVEGLELAVAMAILGSCRHFSAQSLANTLVCGSLALDGGIQ